MEFKIRQGFPSENKKATGICYLVKDKWDDWGFKTSFYAILYDYDGGRYDLGPLKITTKGLKKGRTEIPNKFEELTNEFCSLGNGRDYYLQLSGIHSEIKNEFLKAIRDCVADSSIWHEFQDEESMGTSLMRSASVRDIEYNFPRILAGNAELTPYAFDYSFESGIPERFEKCEFRVEPESLPPSNIHVLIGRNGVGKTRLLAGIADALTNNQATSIGMPGTINFEDDFLSESSDFLNLIVVSYSVFDKFDPIKKGTARSEDAIPYNYVGIKKFHEGSDEQRITLKNEEDLREEFNTALESMLNDPFKMERWCKMVQILESDDGIKDLNLTMIIGEPNAKNLNDITDKFSFMSSGHKIVLLTITRLVEFVSDRSLVLFDEPETHLHPPLLGSLVRALSELLGSTNGVALLATHSPVVLQEVPTNCVSIIDRSGDLIKIKRPEIDTFAENVGALTRKIFNLEYLKSGFYKFISEISEGQEYDDVIEAFDDKIGGEGRALTRALTSKERKQVR